jgi:hypothetical protein
MNSNSTTELEFESLKEIFEEIHKDYKEWIESSVSPRPLYPVCITDSVKRTAILNAPRLDHPPPYASRLASILFKDNFKKEHQRYTGFPYLPYHMSTLERVTYNDSKERACIQYRKFIRTLQGFAVSFEKSLSIPVDN